MMEEGEDQLALAAEYALGTLDADERAQADAMIAADRDFAALVEAWSYRLGALNQMVGSVEPRAEVWDRIREAAGLSGAQMPLLLPEAAPLPPAEPVAAETAPVAQTGNVIAFPGAARRWRTIATAMGAIAAVLVALVVTQVARPDLLPESIRAKPRTQVVQIPAPPAPAPAQYVAVLQKDGGSPAFILTVDGASRNFTVRKVDAAPEPGKSYELWVISDRLGAPRSLGVIGEGDFTARTTLSAYDPNIVTNATYAVTVEPSGGSPNGKPGSDP
ncbi:MAG TPA: anti-sigma factor, partial [Bradyrhizobium sp.]|nr:anti-sigma factor [Bradyrhizobium sp.]